jgi:hypothetical protein
MRGVIHSKKIYFGKEIHISLRERTCLRSVFVDRPMKREIHKGKHVGFGPLVHMFYEVGDNQIDGVEAG